MDLWEWQDRDVARLTREGKDELARSWYDFSEESSAEDLKCAADLARRLQEPWWELFFRHWEIQQALFRQGGNLQVLREESARLSDLAEDPACQDCPQRFCARETVCNTLSSEDPVASAGKVLETASRMDEVVPGDLDCSGCFGVLKVEPLIQLGRIDEAEALVAKLLAEKDEDNRRCVAHGYAALLAERRGDITLMDGHISKMTTLVHEGAVNEDTDWFVTEVQVRRRLLEDDLPGAEAFLRGPNAPPEGSLERIRSLKAIAAAKARLADFAGSRMAARDAAKQALRRGFVRDATEASLLAEEASANLGANDDDRESDRTVLANCLAQLASRDLDDRARALGIDW